MAINNVSLELITGIGLGVIIGLLIDNHLQTKPLMFIIFFIVGTIVGFYNMFKCLKNMVILRKISRNIWQPIKDLYTNLKSLSLFDINFKGIDISFTNSALSMVIS